MSTASELVAELESAHEALVAAVSELYFAANWKADRPVDEARLWTQLRDAAGILPGKSTAALAAPPKAAA